MSKRFLIILFLASAVVSTTYKGLRQVYESFEKKTISEQICRASEARLQVGATREVVDVAHSAVLAAGYLTAEIELNSSGAKFAETKLTSKNAVIFRCNPDGIKNVELSIYFPKATFFTMDVLGVFLISIILLWLIKILTIIFVKGLQVDFANEINKMLSNTLGVDDKNIERTPFWMKWLHELNPSALKSFKRRLTSLENRIERQSKDLQNQAVEKAVKEVQLSDARRFKDLVHQIKHDLKQTVGVVRSSLELMPTVTNGRDVLKGAVGSLETMIGDLTERELKNESIAQTQEDLIEVVITEVVREQRFHLSKNRTQINFVMNEYFLHLVIAPREELKRVLTNLIVNASEAMTSDGVISIETKESGKDYLTIKITDNGAGFSEDALTNLFKKGFTTKAEGSGRGLSFSQQKIREWKGRLFVDSVPGKTVIEITLPTIQAEHWVHPSILKEAHDVIVVDDHPLDLSSVLSMNTKPRSFESLASFEQVYKKGQISSDALIIFDLHLEEGRRSLEALAMLANAQDYLFMTSDYLNPELLAAARERQFLTIPKDLVGFALMNDGNLDRNNQESECRLDRPESPAQI